MTIYVFVIDNSASLAQQTYTGASYLDLAKSFIETFQKARQKESSKDRFMAISCDDYPSCIKTGWRENIGTMMDQLKKLQPVGTNSLETAIGRAFWFLNCNRQYSDFPGFGWSVAKPEPAIVIALTDGIFSLGQYFIPEKIKHPSNDFYKEIYRPDQRCYGVCFRIPPRPATMSSQFETVTGGLANFCMATGGKCFAVSNTRHIPIAVDVILQKSLIFLKLNFSYTGPDIDSDAKNGGTNDDSNSKPETLLWKETFTGILRLPRKDVENRFLWPIPENFWADYSLGQLPQRPECPNVSFTYDPKPAPSWRDGNLFDRYELEPSALTQYILEKKTGHYPIYVVGSGKNNRNYCCGYLVAETVKGYFTNTFDYKIGENLSRLTVILYLVPYNYPVLLSLLEEIEKNTNPKKHLTPLLRQKIVDYINHVPVYYLSALENKPATLKLLLRSHGTPEEDFNRIHYHPRVISTISTWRASLRREYEISITTVHDLLKKGPDVLAEIPKSKVMVDTIFARYGPACHEYTGDGPASFTIEHEPLPKLNPSALFYSAKYIPRKELIINLTKMRVNFNLYGRDHDLHVLQGGMPGQKIKIHEAEDLHNRSIKVMGDFETYNRKLRDIGFAPLREVVPPETTSHAFGNPFKLDKKVVAVDEIAEEGTPETSQRSSSPAPRDTGKNFQQRKRIVRILDASDFTRLRERRGAYSETSSLPSFSRSASPFPDMEDINMEMNGYDSEHRADIPAPNGTSNLRGASPSPSILNGFSNISLKRTLSMEESTDESSSECASPAPSKRRRESAMPSNGALNYSKLNELKIQATKIVKQLTHLSPAETVTQLRNLCEKLTVSDQIAILKCAEENLQRLRRNAIHSAVVNFRRKLQTGQ